MNQIYCEPRETSEKSHHLKNMRPYEDDVMPPPIVEAFIPCQELEQETLSNSAIGDKMSVTSFQQTEQEYIIDKSIQDLRKFCDEFDDFVKSSKFILEKGFSSKIHK